MNLDVTKRFKDFYGDWLNEPIQSLEIQLLTQEWEGNTIQEICLLINATESLPITALKDVYYASNSIIFEHCHSLQAIQKEFLKLAPTELAVALYACSIDTAYFDVLNVLFHPEALLRIQQHLNNRVYLSPHTDLTFANWFVVLERKQDANQNLLLGFETRMSMFDFLKFDFLAIKYQQEIALQKVQDFEIGRDEFLFEKIDTLIRKYLEMLDIMELINFLNGICSLQLGLNLPNEKPLLAQYDLVYFGDKANLIFE